MRQPQTRPSLIARLTSEGNELAWGEFVSVYEPFLKQVVERRGVPESMVSDVSQQLLMTIARSVDGWKDDGQEASFRRWLQRVARNVVIKFMTRERRQIVATGGTDFLEQLEQFPAAAVVDPENGYEWELFIWASKQVQREFRANSWQAFWATQVEGRPVAEVARELGVSPGSIYMSRSRIVSRITEKVQRIYHDDASALQSSACSSSGECSCPNDP